MENRTGPALYAAVFVSGACSLLVEIAGSRVLAPFLGTTIYTWAAVIGLVLASLSLGYYAGGYLADRHNDRRHLSWILICASIATAGIPALGAVFLQPTVSMDLLGGSLFGALILVPASLFYGMVSPYAIKLASEKGSEGRSAGAIFALSTLGSIIGALATGFLLIPNLALGHIFILAGALMLASAFFVSGLKKESVIDLIPFLAAALLSASASMEPALNIPTIHSSDSAYFHIRVVEFSHSGEPARMLMLDDGAESAETASGRPVFEYVRKNEDIYPRLGNVSSALVLGVAGGTELGQLREHFPSAEITGVDIDPEAVQAGRDYLSLADSNGTEIVIDDARRFVRRGGQSYDLIRVDVFRGSSIPPHLATREFVSEVKGRLNPGGVVLLNIIAPAEPDRPGLFPYIYGTYASVFRDVRAIPLMKNQSKAQNIVILASDSDISGLVDGERTLEPAFSAVLSDELNPIELYSPR